MDITYKKVGDYYYPELELTSKYKDFRLDKYGRLRLNYLKENKHIQFLHYYCIKVFFLTFPCYNLL